MGDSHDKMVIVEAVKSYLDNKSNIKISRAEVVVSIKISRVKQKIFMA